MKKALSLLLAAVMLLSVSTGALAAEPVVDSGAVHATAAAAANGDWSTERGPLFDEDNPFDMDVPYNSFTKTHSYSTTLLTPDKIKSVTFSPNDVFGYRIETVVQDTATGKWKTKLWISASMNFFEQKPGDTFKTTCTVTLENNESKSFPCVLNIDDVPYLNFKDYNKLDASGKVLGKWDDVLGVGETIFVQAVVTDKSELLKDRGAKYTWTLEAGSENVEVTPQLNMAADGSIAKLKGLAKGEYELLVELFYADNNQRIHGFILTNEVGGELSGSGGELDDAKDELGKGENTTVDVAPGKGLTVDDLAELKAAAGDTGATVTLTHNNDDRVQLSFDPSKLDPNWNGGTFTPAFITEVPKDATDNGIRQGHSKWINFQFSGKLPAPMTITMKVDPNDFPPNTTIFKVWYFDETLKRLVDKAIPVKYDAVTKTITFTLTSFSTYAVYPASVNPNPQTPTPPPSGGTSSGGGTKSSLTFDVEKLADNAVLKEISSAALAEAVKAASAKGQTSANARVTLTNYTKITPVGVGALQNAAKQATDGTKVKLNLKVNFDEDAGGKTVSRVAVDLDKLAPLVKDNVGLGVYFAQDGVSPVQTTNAIFQKHYTNKIFTISYEHQSALSVNAEFCAKLELAKYFGSDKNLYFYSYDNAKNTCNRITAPNYWVDASGYAHITAPFGGSIIITDKPLEAKK